MRALIIVVLVAALGWSAYWFLGARTLESATREWLAERRAEGWVAETSDIRVRGFPNRFDMTLSDLELADPETGLAWSAPFFQLMALSYRPTHLIAVWPPEQTVASPFGRTEIAAEDLRASLRVTDTRTLTLEEATLVSEGVTLRSADGGAVSLGNGRLAARRVPAAATTYQLGVEALGLRPNDTVGETLDPGRALPPAIKTLRLDAAVMFDAPWDRAAIEEARPQPRAIELSELRADWGPLDLRAAGDLLVGPDGIPEGRITVRAENWRPMLEMAVAAGAVPPAIAPTLETALSLIARTSGSADTLEAPLVLRDGRVFLGPVPLGPAPDLTLR